VFSTYGNKIANRKDRVCCFWYQTWNLMYIHALISNPEVRHCGAKEHEVEVNMLIHGCSVGLQPKFSTGLEENSS